MNFTIGTYSICQITVQINIYISFASEIILSTEPRVLVFEFSTQLRHFLKILMTVSSYSN